MPEDRNLNSNRREDLLSGSMNESDSSNSRSTAPDSMTTLHQLQKHRMGSVYVNAEQRRIAPALLSVLFRPAGFGGALKTLRNTESFLSLLSASNS
jgi:hypothetical protein